MGCDVIGYHLVHDILGRGTGEEVRIAIATGRHEVILGDLVGCTSRQINCGAGAAAVSSLENCAGNPAAGRPFDIIGEAQS